MPHPIAPSITGVRAEGAQAIRTLCFLNDKVFSPKEAEAHLYSCPKVAEGPRQGSLAEGLPETQASAQPRVGGRPLPAASVGCPCPPPPARSCDHQCGQQPPPFPRPRPRPDAGDAKVGICLLLQLGCVQVQEGQHRVPWPRGAASMLSCPPLPCPPYGPLGPLRAEGLQGKMTGNRDCLPHWQRSGLERAGPQLSERPQDLPTPTPTQTRYRQRGRRSS